MCRCAFVRLRRLRVIAKDRKQRYKRQDYYDYAADAVDLLNTHVITSATDCFQPAVTLGHSANQLGHFMDFGV